MSQINSYGVRCKWRDFGQETIINAISAGKAKAEYFYDICDCLPDLKFTDLRVRKIGAPYSSERFIDNAKYRGLPEVRCGQRVKLGESFGTIVGHDECCNFLVVFDLNSRYKGLTLSVHPDEMKIV